MSTAVGRVGRPAWRLRGLPWVTWRQHRMALLGAVVLLGGFAVLLIINGLAMHADRHRLGLDSCGALDGPGCSAAIELFVHRYQSIAQFLPRVVLFVPAVLGAFVGAPLIARELETGSFRFAWTLGTDRARWVRAKLLLLGTALVVMTAAFTALYTWWFAPWVPLMGRMNSGQSYEVEGTIFAARTLFAFTLGALLGTVIRRTVPALAATLAVWVGVVLPEVIYLRPLVQAPVIARADSNEVTGNGWTISDWFQDRAGHHLDDTQINAMLRGSVGRVPGQVPTPRSLDKFLADHGVTEWVKYQPSNRFWHFQLVETAGYLVLAAGLAALTVWWVRRRAT